MRERGCMQDVLQGKGDDLREAGGKAKG